MQRIDTHATFEQLTENIYHTMFNTNQNISGSKMMLRVSLMESWIFKEIWSNACFQSK